MNAEARPGDKPLVLITGAGGNLGKSIAAALQEEYTIVGLDRAAASDPFPIIEADLTSGEAIGAALAQVREEHGSNIASVIHLAAYFDFSGEEHPLYGKLNVEGTRLLLRALALSGRSWLGWETSTPSRLAHELAAPLLAERGLVLADEFEDDVLASVAAG